MTNYKSIWVVSLFEPTPMDNTRPMRSMSIAEAANKKGIMVHHFACTFRHATKVERFNKNTEIKVNELYHVHYVYGSPYVSNTSISRFFSHKEFTNNLLEYIEKLDMPDVILVACPPISTLRKLTQWGNKRGIPIVMDIIDPWPDVFLNFVPTFIRPLIKLSLHPLNVRMKNILRNVAGVSAISKEYLEWAKNKVTNLGKSNYFYPSVPVSYLQEKLNKLIPKIDKNDKLRLIYAGNLGVAYDIPIILSVAEQLNLRYPNKTEFVICGVGYYESEVKRKEGVLSNIRFMGRLNYDDLLQEYVNSHVGLAQYKIGATQSVTYKLFDYLACGLPVLNSLPTEMATIIKDNNVGYNNLPSEPQVLLENIINYINNPELVEEQKKNAISLSYEKGDNDIVYGNMVDFLIS